MLETSQSDDNMYERFTFSRLTFRFTMTITTAVILISYRYRSAIIFSHSVMSTISKQMQCMLCWPFEYTTSAGLGYRLFCKSKGSVHQTILQSGMKVLLKYARPRRDSGFGGLVPTDMVGGRGDPFVGSKSTSSSYSNTGRIDWQMDQDDAEKGKRGSYQWA